MMTAINDQTGGAPVELRVTAAPMEIAIEQVTDYYNEAIARVQELLHELAVATARAEAAQATLKCLGRADRAEATK